MRHGIPRAFQLTRLGPVFLSLGIIVAACGAQQTPLQNEAQQIVTQQQHVAAVQTMTGLLLQQEQADARATDVAVEATRIPLLRQQATATASVQAAQTASVASVQSTETATAHQADVDVQATQAPIIAAATVAAARDAANTQATAIVDAAHQAEILAAQATAVAQTNAATAVALDAAVRADAAAWRARRDAAAHYVMSCEGAAAAASQTTSIADAIIAAQKGPWTTTTGSKPIGTCLDPTATGPAPSVRSQTSGGTGSTPSVRTQSSGSARERTILDATIRLSPGDNGDCVLLDPGHVTLDAQLVGTFGNDPTRTAAVFLNFSGYRETGATAISNVRVTRTPYHMTLAIPGSQYCYGLTNAEPTVALESLADLSNQTQNVTLRIVWEP